MYSEVKFWAQGGIKSHFANGPSEGGGGSGTALSCVGDPYVLQDVKCLHLLPLNVRGGTPPPHHCDRQNYPFKFPETPPLGVCTALSETSSSCFLSMRTYYRPFSTLSL